MKLCTSPPRTSCMYQRIARDQAPPDNGAQQAYAELYRHLDGNNDTEALALLKHLMNCMTDDGATDADEPAGGMYSADPKVGMIEPNPPGSGRDSRLQAQDADFRRRVAIGAQNRARATIAANAAFDKRFPGAARIRTIG